MATPFTSRITVDKEIVSLLSKFAYARSVPYALREVVSNSYDADATTVQIDIDQKKDRVTIRDDGNGMTREQFDFYLRIAGQRRGKRETPKFGRKRIGQFGVGFLSILPFCETLQINSTTDNSEEMFRAIIPARKFFKPGQRDIGVGEVEVKGEISRSGKIRAEHYTRIVLVGLTDLAKRYFSNMRTSGQKSRVKSWPAFERLKWELQDDLPLAFPPQSNLNDILVYPEPIGFNVYFQGEQLWRNASEGDVIDDGELEIDGVKVRYMIITPWKAVKPFELRGLKVRLNNVGVGPREYFGIELGRKYSRSNWLTGEVQIMGGLDDAVTLGRDSFVTGPEYESVRGKLNLKLRKWADYVETVDVAARDMTKHFLGRKQLKVASKMEIVEHNIKILKDRGFSVRQVEKGEAPGSQPVRVDKVKKEVIVYPGHSSLEDTITIDGKKRRIYYMRSKGKPTYENACRLNSDGNLEIDPEYPLFKSKRYGDVFKRIFVITLLARGKYSSSKDMYKFILSRIQQEFSDF